MPGSASYSQSTATLKPPLADRCLERGVDSVGVCGRLQPGGAQLVDEQVVGEVLLEVELGVGVDLVTGVQQLVGEPIDFGADG